MSANHSSDDVVDGRSAEALSPVRIGIDLAEGVDQTVTFHWEGFVGNDQKTMEVIVGGEVRHRAIERCEVHPLGGQGFPPRLVPLHAANEIVVETISGQVHIFPR